jgi:hypothetical protein
LRVARRRVRSAAPLTSRTGYRGIDTRFADFSRSVSPGNPLLAGRFPRLHHIVERRDGIRQIDPGNFASSTILNIRRARIGSDQRLGLVGRENSAECWLRVGRCRRKAPAFDFAQGSLSRKERKKLGTRRFVRRFGYYDACCCSNAICSLIFFCPSATVAATASSLVSNFPITPNPNVVVVETRSLWIFLLPHLPSALK